VGGTPVGCWANDAKADETCNVTPGDVKSVPCDPKKSCCPGKLYNDKISPLLPFKARAVLWYQVQYTVVPYTTTLTLYCFCTVQGEANTDEGYTRTREEYACQMALLITSWRTVLLLLLLLPQLTPPHRTPPLTPLDHPLAYNIHRTPYTVHHTPYTIHHTRPSATICLSSGCKSMGGVAVVAVATLCAFGGAGRMCTTWIVSMLSALPRTMSLGTVHCTIAPYSTLQYHNSTL
jgi:hypothetical protein